MIHAIQARPAEGMSISAKRIEHFRQLQEQYMQDPYGKDLRMYELSQKLRTEAHYYITGSTLDVDFMAFLSREKAAGRTYSSELLARSVFSQAGVVAPPESLKTEILSISGQGV